MKASTRLIPGILLFHLIVWASPSTRAQENLWGTDDDRSYTERYEEKLEEIKRAKADPRAHDKVSDLYANAIALARQIWIFEPDKDYKTVKYGDLKIPMPSKEQFERPQKLADEASKWADENDRPEEAIRWAMYQGYEYQRLPGELPWKAREKLDELIEKAQRRGDARAFSLYHRRIGQDHGAQLEKSASRHRELRSTRREYFVATTLLFLLLAVIAVLWSRGSGSNSGPFVVPIGSVQLGPSIARLKKAKPENVSIGVFVVSSLFATGSLLISLLIVDATIDHTEDALTFVFGIAVFGTAIFLTSSFFFSAHAVSWVFRRRATKRLAPYPEKADVRTLLDGYVFLNALNAHPDRARRMAGIGESWPYRYDPVAVGNALMEIPILPRAILLSWLRDAHPKRETLADQATAAWETWLKKNYPVAGIDLVRWGVGKPHPTLTSKLNVHGHEVEFELDASMETTATLRKRLLEIDRPLVEMIEAAELELVSALGLRWSTNEWPIDWYASGAGFASATVFGCYRNDLLIDTFRVDDDGSFVDAQFEDFTLPQNAEIGVVHRYEFESNAFDAWNQHFAEAELLSPFDQFGRLEWTDAFFGRIPNTDPSEKFEDYYGDGLEAGIPTFSLSLHAWIEDDGYFFADVAHYSTSQFDETFDKILTLEFEHRIATDEPSLLFDYEDILDTVESVTTVFDR